MPRAPSLRRRVFDGVTKSLRPPWRKGASASLGELLDRGVPDDAGLVGGTLEPRAGRPPTSDEERCHGCGLVLPSHPSGHERSRSRPAHAREARRSDHSPAGFLRRPVAPAATCRSAGPRRRTPTAGNMLCINDGVGHRPHVRSSGDAGAFPQDVPILRSTERVRWRRTRHLLTTVLQGTPGHHRPARRRVCLLGGP